MLNEQEIQKVLQPVVERLKNKEESFHPVYDVVAEHAGEVAVHAEGDFPSELISKKYPSESEEEFEYRKGNYQAITKPFWGRALNNIQRIWNPTNYAVEVDDEDASEYLFKNYPKFKDIKKYFAQVVTPGKINYPNSVIAIRPLNIPLKLDDSGEIVVDKAEEVDPIAVFFHSDDVIDYSSRYFLLRTARKSRVSVGGQEKLEGIVFQLYDDMAIWEIVQVGKKDEWRFTIEMWYQHDLEHVPVYFLEGEPRTSGDQVYYVSYFDKALDFLNKVVCQNSTLDATTDKNAYATRVYYESRCDNPKCGYGCELGHEINGEGEEVICHACRGTGKRTMFTPMRDYTIDPNIKTNEEALPFPPLSYVSPGTEILEWLDNKIRRDIEDAFAFMNIDVTNKPNGQTATEAKIDREDLFSFLLLLSKELFMLLAVTMDDIILMKKGKDVDIQIRPPDEFTIRDSAALYEELGTLSQLNISPIAQKSILLEYVARRFTDDARKRQVIEIVYAADSFVNTSATDINLRIQNGTAEKWQQVLHDNLYRYLDKMARDGEDLSDIDKAVEQLVILAKQDTPADAGSVEEILNGIT